MPNQWLHDQVRSEDASWEPGFALQSAINWIRALSSEISGEHGLTPSDQAQSCGRLFAMIGQRTSPVSNAKVFGPLFHSLTFTVSLSSLRERNVVLPWVFPTAVISWYYAVYNATRSILASYDGREHDKHSAVIKSFNDIRSSMPHPFNMVAFHRDGESYDTSLPAHPNAVPYDLSRRFEQDRAKAQGMLLQYLNGTATREVDQIKQGMLARRIVSDFRTRQARDERDRRLPRAINFLHCAFRYRGKANYRDSLFFTYGPADSRLNPDYIAALQQVAQFASICALKYAEQRIGQQAAHDFLDDLKSNFRGQSSAIGTEGFWTTL